jgi:hypothetical protein
MNKTLSLLPLTLLFATGVASAQAKKVAPVPDLAKAQARAMMHNKRVLVVLSAEGEDFAKTLKSNRALSRKLLYEFETVAYAGAKAAKKWHWQHDGSGALVLAANGDELARFPAAELTAKKALASLEPHFCKPVDANKKLAAAMVDAKKTGRNIFIRFDAPW